MDQNTLNLFVVIFLLVIAACAVVITFYLVLALKAFVQSADEVSDAVQSIKEKIQLKALAALPAFLIGLINRLRKRG